MKFSVSCRQPQSTLKKTDEIKVQFKDIEYLFNLVDWYNNKRIVVEIPKDTIVDELVWQTLQAHNDKMNGRFYVCLYNYEHIEKCKEYKLKYYWGIPLTTLYELRGICQLGVSFALIGAPLAFNLKKAKETAKNIRLRMIPNMGFTDHIARIDGVHGAWVRPEDISLYEKYIDTFEFIAKDLQQERGYLSIYQSGAWNDDLNLLINGLNYSVPNYMIDSKEFTQKRLNCGQRCEEGRPCHTCESYLAFVNKNHSYQIYKKEKLENS